MAQRISNGCRKRGAGAAVALYAAMSLITLVTTLPRLTTAFTTRTIRYLPLGGRPTVAGGCGISPSAFMPPRSSSTRTCGRTFTSSSVIRFACAKGRPSLDDVERLSRGQAAKKRGTGSRNICHRLNEMERKEFDLAKKAGFVQLRGTGYRRERKGSPLANIHRQLCDALGRPCIEIHRGLGTDAVDEVVVDMSPLRPSDDRAVAMLQEALQVCVEVDAEMMTTTTTSAADKQVAAAAEEGGAAADGGRSGSDAGKGREWEETRMAFSEEDWETKPIWDLPVLSYVYECGTGDRSMAKRVAQAIYERTSKLAAATKSRR